MASTILVGTQWGDEGKGKVTDLISGEYDVVCRCQGGANAGHTVMANGHKFGRSEERRVGKECRL